MAFSEETVISKIEILEDGQMQIRRSDRVLKDGVVIAETYHREVLKPGSNLEGKDARIVAAANAIWTPAVIQAFEDKSQLRDARAPKA